MLEEEWKTGLGERCEARFRKVGIVGLRDSRSRGLMKQRAARTTEFLFSELGNGSAEDGVPKYPIGAGVVQQGKNGARAE